MEKVLRKPELLRVISFKVIELIIDSKSPSFISVVVILLI